MALGRARRNLRAQTVLIASQLEIRNQKKNDTRRSNTPAAMPRMDVREQAGVALRSLGRKTEQSGTLNQTLFRPPAPTPRDEPLTLFALLSVLRNNPLEAWTRAHFTQPFVRSGLPFLPVIVVSQPTAIQRVLLDNAANYRKDDFLLRVLSGALDNGLLTVDGDQWRRQRRAVAPLFARKTIFGFAPQVLDAADALVARWNELADGRVIDVADEITHTTLDVLSRTIFSQGIEREIDDFQSAMRIYFDTIGRIDPMDALGLPEFLPRPTRFRARGAIRFFDEAVDAIIERRRRLLAEAPGESPRDLLTLLLEARDASGAPLDEKEVRANIFTFIAAGHETTANAVTWSLFLLSQDPEWAARVAAEADCSPQGDDPRAHLVETRAVIEEALRLYPPIAAISRAAIEDDELAGEPVRAGTMVIVAPYVVHRHELLWTAPSAFDPHRFLGRAREDVNRFAYLPFGTGPRICVGAAFALQEAMLLLMSITRNFTLSAIPGAAVEPLLRITLRPKGGLPMRLSRRSR